MNIKKIIISLSLIFTVLLIISSCSSDVSGESINNTSSNQKNDEVAKIELNCEGETSTFFKGMSGFGKISCVINADFFDDLAGFDYDKMNDAHALRESIEYKYDNQENLKNGDKINVSITYNEDYSSKLNLNVTHTEFEIIVEGLDEYITPENITDEDLTWFDDEVWRIVDEGINTGFYTSATDFDPSINVVFGLVEKNKLELNTRYVNVRKDPTTLIEKSINSSKFESDYCSMYYVFNLSVTVKINLLGEQKSASGIFIYHINNPVRKSDGSYKYDFSLVPHDAYPDIEGFNEYYIKGNEADFNIVEFKV